MGWDKEAYVRFVELCNQIKQQREEPRSEDLEQIFRERANKEYVEGCGSARHHRGAKIPSFDELDD